MERFFFYGTLQRGGFYYHQCNLAQRARYLCDDTVTGALFDCGEYPALVRNANGSVHGEVFELLDPTLLAAIDAVEDYRPDQPKLSEYLRVPATTAGGIAVWTYVYNRPVTGLRPLSSGCWRPPGI